LNSTSSVQWRHTNQYLLPLGLSFLHLKLQPHSRQMAQHISWSQGHSTSPLISKSILWTSTPVWTTPDKNNIYYRILYLRITSLYFMNSSLVSKFSHILLYKLRFFFNFIYHSSAWYLFSISYTVDSLVSSLSVVATNSRVSSLITGISVLVEDELYGY